MTSPLHDEELVVAFWRAMPGHGLTRFAVVDPMHLRESGIIVTEE
jgi:hypothetical protein